MILADVRLLSGQRSKIPRANIKIYDLVKVNIYCFIYACYELEPEFESEEIMPRVEINFAKLRSSMKVRIRVNNCKTDANGVLKEDEMSVNSDVCTKNPIFGKRNQGVFKYATTEVMGSIDLAPNFILHVKNIHQSGFSILGKKSKLIGTISMHPTDQTKFVRLRDDNDLTDKLKPKFYTIKNNGEIKGKLLGFFAYSSSAKNEISLDKFRNTFKLSMKNFKLDFSVVGLRNLDSRNSKPEIHLAIPSYRFLAKIVPKKIGQRLDMSKEEKEGDAIAQISVYDPTEYKKSVSSNLLDYNPNICKCVKIDDLLLPSDPLYWPRAEITIINTESSGEKLFHTINLIECCEELVSALKLKKYLEAIGIKKKTEGKKDISSMAFGNGDETTGTNTIWKAEEQRTIIFRNSVKGKTWQKAPGKATFGNMGGTNLNPRGTRKKVGLGLIEENGVEEDEEDDSDEVEGFNNPFYRKQFSKKRSLGASESKPQGTNLMISGIGMNHIDQNNPSDTINIDKSRIPNVYFEELEPLNLLGESHRAATESGFYNGFTLQCLNLHKKLEMNKRKSRILEFRQKIKELKSDPNYDENLLSNYITRIKIIQNEFVNENKFFDYNLNDDKENFNYGRKIEKGNVDDSLKLPYKKLKLYFVGGNFTRVKGIRVNNFVHTGASKGGILKGGVRIRSKEAEEIEELQKTRKSSKGNSLI